MTVLAGQTIRRLGLLDPMREKYLDSSGCSCGLSIAGYDITLDNDVIFEPRRLTFASSAERFLMPDHVNGIVHDKSSLARKGLAVQNTVIEPGWRGFLTLEVMNNTDENIFRSKGDAIAQVVFHFLDAPAERPYAGKYQDQKAGPQGPLKEDGSPL
jgi:dCTP deaminase